MKIEKPVFIVGSGRNGSTLFQQLLSNHRHIACIPRISNIFPQHKIINKVIAKISDIELLRKLFSNIFSPSEAYILWEYYCKGFTHPFRDLIASDVTPKTRESVKQMLLPLVTSKRNRLVVKLTGLPRIGFLKEIFKDAKFIHIVRDGRAVANSLINVDWWWKFRGPTIWNIERSGRGIQEEWAKFNFSYLALAGIELKMLFDMFDLAKSKIEEEDVLEIKYENLCDESITTMKEVIDFCELSWNDKFEKSITSADVRSRNYNWEKELTEDQINILNIILNDVLKKYEYI